MKLSLIFDAKTQRHIARIHGNLFVLDKNEPIPQTKFGEYAIIGRLGNHPSGWIVSPASKFVHKKLAMLPSTLLTPLTGAVENERYTTNHRGLRSLITAPVHKQDFQRAVASATSDGMTNVLWRGPDGEETAMCVPSSGFTAVLYSLQVGSCVGEKTILGFDHPNDLLGRYAVVHLKWHNAQRWALYQEHLQVPDSLTLTQMYGGEKEDDVDLSLHLSVNWDNTNSGTWNSTVQNYLLPLFARFVAPPFKSNGSL